MIAQLRALGRPVEISYSGDADYEPSAPVILTLPADTTVVIVPRCKSEQTPVTSPGPDDPDEPDDSPDEPGGSPGADDPGDRDGATTPADPATPATPTTPADPTAPTTPTTPGPSPASTPSTAVLAIAIAAPRDGARYAVGEDVEADYSCRVAGGRSRIASCEGTVAHGSMIDTASVGTFRFMVTAEDEDGNIAVKTVTYTVGAGDDH